MSQAERVGIIFVHGVGEQRRFQHLNGEARNLLDALRREAKAKGGQIDVEIVNPGHAALLADQDTWNGGPKSAVRIIASGLAEHEIQFHLHEVWWADVNETYSLAKQFRFWLWGLSVWRYPAKKASRLPSADDVYPPVPQGRWAVIWTRVRLFGVGVVFALLGFSIGTISFLLKRVFDLDPPELLRTITNYVSGVKLYNQRRRFSGGLIPKDDEFLDAIDEPPRVSIRRRMIRTIAQTALNDYDRWYVLAHSLGTVVAFNGLMETAWAWPGYLDEPLWRDLKAHVPPLAGPSRPDWPGHGSATVPKRPVWSGGDVVYRSRVFERFRGFLTYGCPLDKFAAIWPARVPIARIPAFGPDAVWVNVYDPMDPISGSLKAFQRQPVDCCPRPNNVGYASYWVLMLAHICYFTAKTMQPDLAAATVRWLLGTANPPGSVNNSLGALQFSDGDIRRKLRTAAAWMTWIVVFLALSLTGGYVFPLVLKAVCAAGHAILAASYDMFAKR